MAIGSIRKVAPRIAIVGAGSWGTAVANVFADVGGDVTLWGRDAEAVRHIHERHENHKYLKGVMLNVALKASRDLSGTLAAADIVVCSIPTQQIRSVFAPYAELLAGKTIVNTSKGIEIGTDARVSEIFAELAPSAKYVALSGPSFALEVVQRLPTAVTVASTDKESASEIQRLMSTPYFRAYTSRDVVGVELAGALKNVVAIASGMVTGLKLGYNAQAALINRGIVEMARMGRKLGAEPLTFLGLAGMGDLVLTCTGPLSRNRRVGVLLGEGKKLDQIQRDLGGVAEGVFTARSSRDLARKHGIEMPIGEQIYGIVHDGVSPSKALSSLMGRDLKEEWGELP